MRSIPPAAFDLVKEQEDSILWVYDDAKGARHKDGTPREVVDGDKILGVLTAGTGHTGADVVPGMTVTQEMNDAWLYDDLQEAAHKITAKIGAAIVDMLTENQWIALLDFVLNLGTGRPDRPEWTIWKRLRDKHFDQVPLEMAKFVNAEVGGVMRKIPDLVRRRNKEVEIWSTDEPGTRDVQMPSSVTRADRHAAHAERSGAHVEIQGAAAGRRGIDRRRTADDQSGQPVDSALRAPLRVCAKGAGDPGDAGGAMCGRRPGLYVAVEAASPKLRSAHAFAVAYRLAGRRRDLGGLHARRVLLRT
jgi:GH24 family phage-related lysozyme (muramidase)